MFVISGCAAVILVGLALAIAAGSGSARAETGETTASSTRDTAHQSARARHAGTSAAPVIRTGRSPSAVVSPVASPSAMPLAAATIRAAAEVRAAATAIDPIPESVQSASTTPSEPSVNLGPANVGRFNVGGGNVGDVNIGNGNIGNFNLGAANKGNGNIGLGNSGDANLGFGNSGNNNVGLGNTGTGNIGFGNTGVGNIGIGLTGDYQIGFGGWNSGTGNFGLFNSGSGNTGFFNSGINNSGLANSGDTNTGAFNTGIANTGVSNAGAFNTGSFNTGGHNSGSFNPGDTNTGGFNTGDRNTGWLNSGDANTGLANLGNLNTGAFNFGDANNGFFIVDNGQNWFPGIRLAFTAPGIAIDELQTITIDQQFVVGPVTITIGPAPIDVRVTGNTGPLVITVLDIPAGPGFFNSALSSGFFNSGGGGSGLFNSGVGSSGLWNQVTGSQTVGVGLSGVLNSGSASSGWANLGSGVSGLLNTSAVDVTAVVSGVGNVGAGLSGLFFDQVSGKSSLNLGVGNVGSWNVGGGNVGDHNVGFGNAGVWNLGSGNVGDVNLGFGNLGSGNVGSGNSGDDNVGFGNLGDDNFGVGNSGDGNVGFGNTGVGNIGFGNTGVGNIGIGLSGDYQIGFGGWNSGTSNVGLFNSGTGNTGLFNSGVNNSGVGNSGSTNTGLFNSGAVNTGFANSGVFNTGWHNGGDYNSGAGNAGDVNTGAFNVGDRNTGWWNPGDANTGIANTGDLNTGALITGSRDNGFFWRGDNQGQLDIDIGADISSIPITLNADIPLNIPITATLTEPIEIRGLTVPAIGGSVSGLLDLTVRTAAGNIGPIRIPLTPLIGIGPITVPTITIDATDPLLSALIGGPGTSIPITVNGLIGPGRISLLHFTGPGLFNTTELPSSGLFNAGAGGGSGLFNSAAGSSGLWNQVLRARAPTSILDINLSRIPLSLHADIPLDIPITAAFADIRLESFTIPGFPITTTNWQTVTNEPVTLPAPLGAVFFDFKVPSGLLPVSDITLQTVTVGLPDLAGVIGGPDGRIGLDVDAAIGATTISLQTAATGTPALSRQVVQHGAGDRGASGLFNTGSQMSGFANVGTGISGWLNTGADDPALPAWLSGLANVGSDASGWLHDPLGIGDYIGRVLDRFTPAPAPQPLDTIVIAETPFELSVDVPVNVPLSLRATPIQISQIAVPAVSVGPGLVIQADIKTWTFPPSLFFPPCYTACMVLQIAPAVGLGPVAIGPIEAGFAGGQVFSAAIGGPGKGIRVSGAAPGDRVAVFGPVRIDLVDGEIDPFPYSYDVEFAADIPGDVETGALDLDQSTASIPLQLLLAQRLGYCILNGISGCDPVGFTGATMSAYLQTGVFPPSLPWTSTVTESNLGGDIGPSTIAPGTDIDAGVQQDGNGSGIGVLGPFPFA